MILTHSEQVFLLFGCSVCGFRACGACYLGRLVKHRKVFNAKVMARIFAEWANFRPTAPTNRDIFISPEIGSTLDIA